MSPAELIEAALREHLRIRPQECAALEKHRQRAEQAEAALASARNLCARSPLCIPEGTDHA